LADRARSPLPALAVVDSATRLDAWTRSSKLSGPVLAIVDTGPIYAVADSDDQDHDRCLEVLQRSDLELVVPALVVAEATYLIGTRLGSSAEAQFLRGLAALEVESPSTEDWAAMAGLVERYADFPLGGTDACVAAIADRLGTDVIVTLDQRHFGVVRSQTGRPYQLLPS
jgi:predicted nucleic acid-binding protein